MASLGSKVFYFVLFHCVNGHRWVFEALSKSAIPERLSAPQRSGTNGRLLTFLLRSRYGTSRDYDFEWRRACDGTDVRTGTWRASTVLPTSQTQAKRLPLNLATEARSLISMASLVRGESIVYLLECKLEEALADKDQLASALHNVSRDNQRQAQDHV